MRKILCESPFCETIEFNHRFPFYLESIDGIHDVIGTVAGIKSAFSIGENYIGTSEEKRNIILKGKIVDNVNENRQKLYRVFVLKGTGTLYYLDGDYKRKIQYQVESIKISDVGIYKNFQISLICPNPRFTDIDKTVLQMANWLPGFKFPLQIPYDKGIKFGTKNITSMVSILNENNIEFGMTIIFRANGVVVNPSLFNVDSREELKIEKTMQAGDEITVITHRQNKNVTYYSQETGLTENINNLIVFGSKFLQIHCGQNTFRYNADENIDNLETTIEYYNEYEAI